MDTACMDWWNMKYICFIITWDLTHMHTTHIHTRHEGCSLCWYQRRCCSSVLYHRLCSAPSISPCIALRDSPQRGSRTQIRSLWSFAVRSLFTIWEIAADVVDTDNRATCIAAYCMCIQCCRWYAKRSSATRSSCGVIQTIMWHWRSWPLLRHIDQSSSTPHAVLWSWRRLCLSQSPLSTGSG